MKIQREKLPYREGAVAIIVDSKGRFLLIQALVYKDNEWKFAGGGVDPGETPEQTILRELKEELGSDKFEIVKKSKTVNQYDWTDEMILEAQERKGGWWRGQRQHQFLVKFTGDKREIKLLPSEIKNLKWVTRDELPKHLIFPEQWEKAKLVLDELLG
ncbi:MAG: NUDIX domain-containing protein [bacterium]|nr:NUDIX domain-containing protein [bacterium]